MATSKQTAVRDTAVNKATYTAVKDFEHAVFGAHAKGDAVAIPDGWLFDKAETEHIHMSDKKAAIVAKVDYSPRRTVFYTQLPRYEVDERGRLTDKVKGYDIRRVVLPVA